MEWTFGHLHTRQSEPNLADGCARTGRGDTHSGLPTDHKRATRNPSTSGFRDGDRFAGQGRFIDRESGREFGHVDQGTVGGNTVTLPQHDQISHNQLCAWDPDRWVILLPIASNNACMGRSQIAERLKGPFGSTVLNHRQHNHDQCKAEQQAGFRRVPQNQVGGTA